MADYREAAFQYVKTMDVFAGERQRLYASFLAGAKLGSETTAKEFREAEDAMIREAFAEPKDSDNA